MLEPCTSSAARAAVLMRSSVWQVQIFDLRHRIVPAITGHLIVVEEYIIRLKAPVESNDIDRVYEIDCIRDWDSGELVDLGVFPVPPPPPFHIRRGVHLLWQN